MTPREEAERLVAAAQQALARSRASTARAERVLNKAVEDRDRLAGLEELHSAVESGDPPAIEAAREKLRKKR